MYNKFTDILNRKIPKKFHKKMNLIFTGVSLICLGGSFIVPIPYKFILSNMSMSISYMYYLNNAEFADLSSKEYQEIEKYYEIFLDNFVTLCRKLDINSYEELLALYKYMLDNGYLSLSDEFIYKTNVLESQRNLGATIVTGEGCCRHINLFFTDILKKLNCKAFNLTLVNEDITKNCHVISVVENGENYLMFDPTNNMKVIYNEGKFEIGDSSYVPFTNDKVFRLVNKKKVSFDFKNKNSVSIDPLECFDEKFIRKLSVNYDYFERFYGKNEVIFKEIEKRLKYVSE